MGQRKVFNFLFSDTEISDEKSYLCKEVYGTEKIRS